MTDARYYIYEHWRPDTDMCFYVGRGTGQRAFRFYSYSRNTHHARIVAKLAAQGMCVEVRMYASGLTRAEAMVKERERIAFWQSLNVGIVNQTAGGDGVPEPTAEVRAKMSRAHKTRWTPERVALAATKAKKQWEDPAFRARYSAAVAGRKISAEHAARLQEGNKKSWANPARRAKRREQSSGENNPFFGKRHEPEVLARIAEKKRGTKMSDETKARMREAQQLRRAREKA